MRSLFKILLFVNCTKITDWKRREFVLIMIRFELFVLSEERCDVYIFYNSGKEFEKTWF